LDAATPFVLDFNKDVLMRILSIAEIFLMMIKLLFYFRVYLTLSKLIQLIKNVISESSTFIGFLFFWILIFSLSNIVAGYDIPPGDLHVGDSTNHIEHSTSYPVVEIFL
jgi:hypothetical protein